MLLYEDRELILKLKEKADKFLKLFNTGEHWPIHKSELENWHKEISDLGDRLIKIEDVIEYPILLKFKQCSGSIYGGNIAKNLKHNMKNTLTIFYSIFPILYKKTYGKKYTGNLPDTI